MAADRIRHSSYKSLCTRHIVSIWVSFVPSGLQMSSSRSSVSLFLAGGQCLLQPERAGGEDEGDDPPAEHHLPADGAGEGSGR